MANRVTQRGRFLHVAILLILLIGVPKVGHAVIRDPKIPATDERMIKWIAAARDGDLAAVKALLEGGMDINARDNSGDTALSWAAFNGRTEVVKYLLEKGADTTLQNTTPRSFGSNYTPLMYAAAGGHLELVGLLYDKVDPKLKEDASFDGIRNLGLRAAAKAGQIRVMQFFVDQGADVNAKSTSGRTALMEATVSLSGDVIKFLLDKGADVRAKDKDGVTALHMAAVRGWRLEMTRLMVEKGAEVNAKTTTGETPLFWASQTNSVGAVKYLFDKGATVDLDAKEFAGLPILIWAAMNHPPSLKALLDKGADVEVKDGAGRTPLMMAAKAGQIEAVRLLLEKGASVTAKAANGDTALKLAGNKKEIADLLRQKGATE